MEVGQTDAVKQTKSAQCGTGTTLCDWGMAREFLSMLDEGARTYTFQTFSDDRSLIRYETTYPNRAPGEASQKGDRPKKVKKDPNAKVIDSALTDGLCERLERANLKGAYVGVTVNETDGKGRKLENIKRVRAVIADFDHGLPDTFPLKPSALVNSSEGKYQAYWFVGDDMPPALASGIAITLVREYGADSNCTDLSRVLRLPGTFHMKTGKPRPVTVEYALDEDGFAQQYKAETIARAFPPTEAVTRKSAGYAILKTGTANPDDVRAALHAIAHLASDEDPRESNVENRATWLKFGCAIKREFGDAGLDMWLEWSKLAGHDVYVEDDALRVWTSISDSTYSGQPCTVGTIFHCAKEAGWLRPGSMAELHSLASESTFQLEPNMQAFAVPAIHEEQVAAAQTAIEFGTSVATWTSELAAKMLKTMNKELAVLPTESGSVRILYRKQNASGRWENRFMRSEEVAALFAHIRFDVDGRKRTAFQAWFEWKDRRQYAGCGMYPGSKKHPATEPRNFLNLWPGYAIEPKPGDWSLLQAHIRDNICKGNETHYNWLIDWFAQMVQQPQRKGRSSVVLRSSKKGTGKTMFVKFMRGVLGDLVAVANTVEQITGRFNNILNGNLLLIAEEAVWGGDKASEGALKALVTDETMRIEPKGLEAYEAPNYTRLLVLSNNDWVAPVDIHERRWFVADVDHDRANDPAYFDPIFKQMEDGGLHAMLNDLLERVIKSDLGRPPETAALVKQREHGLDGLHRWLRDTAEGGGVLTEDGREMFSTTSSTTLTRDLVKASAKQFVNKYEERSLDTRLGMLLRDVGVEDGGKITTVKGRARERAWVFPDASEFADKVAARLNITISRD